MRREWRERFPRHRLQRKPLVSDPGVHHRTCVTHVPWCMSGSLTHGGGENVLGIPGACATRNFTYLARGPCHDVTMTDSHYSHNCKQNYFNIHICFESSFKIRHMTVISILAAGFMYKKLLTHVSHENSIIQKNSESIQRMPAYSS